MGHIVQADAQGALVLPPGLVPPRTAFLIEASGDDVVLRRTAKTSPDVPDSDTAGARIGRLRAWIAALPPGPPIPEEATHRDSMYD